MSSVREPHTQEVSRQNKTCFLFLLDQSFSMEDPLGNSSQRKCDQVAQAVNGWLNNMVIRAGGAEGIKDWMDVGVLGYRTDDAATAIIEPVLQGPLAGRTLVSISELGDNPARVDQVTKLVPDEATGGTFEMPAEVRVWVDIKAEGGTPMCNALYKAHEVLEAWIKNHRKSFPPTVINITDGESQDGDPIPYAEALQGLETEDGSVLVFNCHLSATAADSFVFPASDELLPDAFARQLFQMSSPLPKPIWQRATAEGVELLPNARGMAFNADMVALIQFLDWGTRVALR